MSLNERELRDQLQKQLAELEAKIAKEDAVKAAERLVNPEVSDDDKKAVLQQLIEISGLKVSLAGKRGGGGKRGPMSEETKRKIAESRVKNKAANA